MSERKYFAVTAATASLFLAGSITGLAQDADENSADEPEMEEIVVTGSHIKGANITGALPVSVIGAEEIEATGVESGDDLMQFIPEQGQNFFNEAENISGGVNSARGDIGAFNLRSLGTGNTLVLFNGRRVVNAASYQTEEVGGSFVPVNTANTQTIPIYGMDRLEILKDGASALYGADAVAGVVNYVVRDNIDHLRVYLRYGAYDHVSRDTQRVALEWGDSFNGERTRVGVLANYYARDRISAHEDERWADADFRRRVPEDSPWTGDTRFRNTSINSFYGQFDVRASARSTGLRNVFTDTSGEFQVYPQGHEDCDWDLGHGNCGAIDGDPIYRHNLNETRDLSSDLKRGTMFLFLNHEFENGMESFSELLYYMSDTHLFRHASAPFSTVKLRVSADNYYNPFGPCGSPNRLPNLPSQVPCEGLELEIDNLRFLEFPRIVENDGNVVRLLTGLRGSAGKWDWEGAAVWSRAEKDDLTRNRVSNLLMVEALSDPTPAAYNPFSAGVNSNIERALVDVYRNNETTLAMADFQVSTPELFDLPWGPAGGVAGVEFRRETFEDDRDPRLDGTFVFTDFQGDTFPYVSDVVNSSPTPDNTGSRNVTSVFTELQLPLMSNINVQLAARYEDFSDVGSTVVPKFAIGWQVLPSVLLRGSWSEAFRAPNLITINEVIVARQNTRNDYACVFAANTGGDPDQDIVDCRNSTQRIAQGSKLLEPERSDNYSFGIVVQPLETLTLTLDWWSIRKEDTIGLLGEENHTVLDLLARLEHGPGNCGGLSANPAVVREAAGTLSDDEVAVYQAAGICPAGLIRYIDDNYVNLDTRTLKGWDASLRYSVETGVGDFSLTYLASFLTKFDQVPGGRAAELVAATEAGTIPASIPVSGFADLLQKDGNQKVRQTLFLSWRRNPFRVGLSARNLGDFYQNSLTLDDGSLYWIPSVTTWNATFDYNWDMVDRDWRLRLGVNNMFDKRAPLADRFFGFFADAHQGIEYGRNYYLQVRVTQDND